MIALSVVTLALMAANPSDAPEGYAYAVAVIEAAPDATPQKLIGAWEKMMQERSLEPDLFDAKAGVAVGKWMNRPHVCTGRVRYHAVLHADRHLKLYMVAECFGSDVALDRAVSGLSDELGRRLGMKNASRPAQVQDVPKRLWEARSARGGAVPTDLAPGITVKPD